jgi:predicted phosphate transport protein (TIGR00153 family)
MFFWKKERQVETAIEEYLLVVEAAMSTMSEAFDIYFAEGLCEKFRSLVEKTHEHEHAADLKRRAIESAMYGKSLIPESRGDILGMLEAIDLVPGKCESVLYQVWMQNMSIPAEFTDHIRQLVAVNLESGRALCQTMRELFIRVKNVHGGATMVSESERQSDGIERTLIKQIFSSQIDKVDMILLKELVLEIGAISDLAENAAERLMIISVKRQS